MRDEMLSIFISVQAKSCAIDMLRKEFSPCLQLLYLSGECINLSAFHRCEKQADANIFHALEPLVKLGILG